MPGTCCLQIARDSAAAGYVLAVPIQGISNSILRLEVAAQQL